MIAYRRNDRRERIRRDSEMRRVDDPLEDPPDLAYRRFLSRLETKSRAVNSDRSRGSNGREKNLSSSLALLLSMLFWKHFHGQRVRNHLGSQVANNDTRSFLRKVSSDLSRRVCVCARFTRYARIRAHIHTTCIYRRIQAHHSRP